MRVLPLVAIVVIAVAVIVGVVLWRASPWLTFSWFVGLATLGVSGVLIMISRGETEWRWPRHPLSPEEQEQFDSLLRGPAHLRGEQYREWVAGPRNPFNNPMSGLRGRLRTRKEDRQRRKEELEAASLNPHRSPDPPQRFSSPEPSDPLLESPTPGSKQGGAVAPLDPVRGDPFAVRVPPAPELRGTYRCKVVGCRNQRPRKQVACSHHEPLRQFYVTQYDVTKPGVSEILRATEADRTRELGPGERQLVLDHLYWRAGLDALLGEEVDARHAQFTERVKQLLPPSARKNFAMQVRE